MKIILSRKGFDSQNGGIPSPILHDGTMLSLPIPTSEQNARYDKLQYKGVKYSQIIKSLGGKAKKYCHLDPDIMGCRKGFVPAFGQANQSASHLLNNGVGIGDLFLFFGWFRHTDGNLKSLKFKGESGFHAVFGYMQVGAVIDLNTNREMARKICPNHPHVKEKGSHRKTNILYLPSEHLSFNSKKPGYGTFKFNDKLRLTIKGKDELRTHWNLPDYFKKAHITYHSNKSWEKGYFKSADKGQEFVITGSNRVINWAKRLISFT